MCVFMRMQLILAFEEQVAIAVTATVAHCERIEFIWYGLG